MAAATGKGKGTDAGRGRKADKETRRQQLIDATIVSLAKRGYAETTLADVSDGAGLSRGIINFYFDSKEKLLIETLQYLSDEYAAHWRAAFDRADARPASKIYALVSADFDRKICTSKTLAAWCAFWGEAKSRPTYQERCGARDLDYQNQMIGLCEALIAEGGYDIPPEETAFAILSTLEGLWHRLMMEDGGLNPEKACGVARNLLRTCFPRHFIRTERGIAPAPALLPA